MNYLDIPTLAQDDFSMGRPTFPTPSGGVLTVVGYNGGKGSRKMYFVHCSHCAKDRELFGDGLFPSKKGNLINGQCPCGCSRSPAWSEEQHRVLARRAAGTAGYTFYGWAELFHGKGTKCRLSCSNHGEWTSTSIEKLRAGRGCPACRSVKTGERSAIPEPEHIAGFMATGSFLPGTTFWRLDSKYFGYACPKCSNDEYVKAGLCSGVFKGFTGNLKKGIVSCRCSSSYRYSKVQWEFRIKQEMARRGEKSRPAYTFSKWLSKRYDAKAKFTYICIEHGEQTVTVDAFLRGCGCPQCAGNNQQHAYINLVIDNGLPVALKLGIANDATYRLRTQNRTNLFQMGHIAVWNFPTVEACRAAETECKRTLDCGVLSCRELADGWSETTRLQNYDAVVAIYEKWGGERIEETTPTTSEIYLERCAG